MTRTATNIAAKMNTAEGLGAALIFMADRSETLRAKIAEMTLADDMAGLIAMAQAWQRAALAAY